MKKVIDFMIEAYEDSVFVRLVCLGILTVAGALIFILSIAMVRWVGAGPWGKTPQLMELPSAVDFVLRVVLLVIWIYAAFRLSFLPSTVRRWHWMACVSGIPAIGLKAMLFGSVTSSLAALLAGGATCLAGIVMACTGAWIFDSLSGAQHGREKQLNHFLDENRRHKRRNWGIWQERGGKEAP